MIVEEYIHRLDLRRTRYPLLFFRRGERATEPLKSVRISPKTLVRVREKVRVYVRVNFTSGGGADMPTDIIIIIIE